MTINQLTHQILGCAFKVHAALGPGLLESAYQECLYYEMQKSNLLVERQKMLPVKYDEIELNIGYRIDLLVENRVILEIKSVESFAPIHFAQVLTYLKLSQCKIGLLLNFNVVSLKQGIKRLIID